MNNPIQLTEGEGEKVLKNVKENGLNKDGKKRLIMDELEQDKAKAISIKCPECGEDRDPEKDFRKHPVSGKRYSVCKHCIGEKIARKRRKPLSEKTDDIKGNPPKATDNKLIIDLSDYAEFGIHEKLRTAGYANIRTPEQEALFLIVKGLKKDYPDIAKVK